jgi:hypothetical protein
LVDPRNSGILSQVMRLATSMWGGQMCPIIPVMKRLPRRWQKETLKRTPAEVMQGYLRFFEPDVLVQTAPDQFSMLGVNEDRSFGKRRFHSLDEVVQKEPGLKADLNVGVNMYYRYWHLFKTEFQFAKRMKPRIVYFKEGGRAETAFFEAAFGCFPRDKDLDYLPPNYKEALDAEEVEPSTEAWLEIVKGGAGYPLYYTVRDMDLQVGERADPSIFIFDPLNPGDLIDFWNFRLFTRDVMPVNSRWLAQSRDCIVECIRRDYRPLPTNRHGVMINTAIHVARSLNLEATVASLNFEEFRLPNHSYTIRGWYPDIWQERDDEDRISRPVAAVLSVKEREIQIIPSGQQRITIQYPVQAPDFDAGRMGNGPKWINTITVRQYASNPEIALALPSAGFESKANYPAVGPGDQFVSREGFVTFHHYAHDDSYLELPSPGQAIKSWLAADGIEAKPSDAGRVAEQVIASVGGLNGSHIFRELDVVVLLDKMARSRKVWSDGSSEEYEDRTAPVQRWLQILNPIQKKLYGRWRTLDRFVEDGILQLGLSVRCPFCTQKNWYSLDEVGSHVRCSRCVKEFPYPQGQSNATPWEYRVVGPFATPHFARGGYSVALTLRFLDDGFSSMNGFTYSTGLELRRDGQAVETDFFAWHNQQGFGRAPKNPITLVGECKSLGSDSFKKHDIERLKTLSALIPGTYLVASTMKDILSAGEMKRLRALAKWGWNQPRPSPLIVLTGLELFGDGPFSHTWEIAGGRPAEAIERYRYIFDFPTLAAASQEVHLGMEPEEVADMRYRRHRRARTRPKSVSGKLST